ncbi:MAG: hypothetical protein SGPRY_006216 [Prymnesium sp.]
MAVSAFELDIVRIDSEGEEVPVPLYDHYLHHYILEVGSTHAMKTLHAARLQPGTALRHMGGFHRLKEISGLGLGDFVYFGGASGAEYRHNPHKYQPPYRMVLRQPSLWAPLLHMINTGNSTRAYGGTPSPLLQCPCTPQRVFNISAGTIDGHRPDPPFGGCDRKFDHDNPWAPCALIMNLITSHYVTDRLSPPLSPISCSLSTYMGGWRCCGDGVFLIDTDRCAKQGCTDLARSEVVFKATFHYDAVSVEEIGRSVKPLEPAGCCDVTSDSMRVGNIEYDVLPCAPGTPVEKCVDVQTTVQPVQIYNSRADGDVLVDLAFAAPHLHVTALSLELQDAETNRTLCKVNSTPNGGILYGGSMDAGDENNYLTGLRPCVWAGGSAPRFPRRHKLRTIAVYNASKRQTGVMSLWLMNTANASWSAQDTLRLEASS